MDQETKGFMAHHQWRESVWILSWNEREHVGVWLHMLGYFIVDYLTDNPQGTFYNRNLGDNFSFSVYSASFC